MEPIDAVISWVDGQDINFQAKLREFCKEQNLNPNTIIEPTRINQVNEIYYCLACLNKHTPWLRNIYIITNQQTPPALAKLRNNDFIKKIQIIDQNQLLQAHSISNPIFNSLSVEWLIWLIPNLSTHFLYLNDDFFITRPLNPEDFFINDKIKIRGKWKVQAEKKLSFKLKSSLSNILNLKTPQPKTNPHRNWQEQAAKIAGFDTKFYFLEHAPFALDKYEFHQYIQKHPRVFTANASKPFRCPTHVSSIPLSVHFALSKHKAIDDKTKQAIMVNGATHSLQKIKQRLKLASTNPKISFVCMQSIDQAPFAIKEYMLNWLENCIN